MRPFQIGTFRSGSGSGVDNEILLGLADFAIARGWILRADVMSVEVVAGKEPPPPVDVCVVPPLRGDALRWLAGHGKPTIAVAADAAPENITLFSPDEQAVGQAAAQHLLDRGLQHFATFSLANAPFAVARVAAFADAIRAAGANYVATGARFLAPELPAQPGTVLLTLANIRRWIAELPKPIGVFVTCDNWAPLVLNQAIDVGCAVPDQLALVGADNIEVFCQTSTPPLSSVMIPWRKMGSEIGQLIARTVALGQPLPMQRFVFPPAGVAVRQSSDVLAVSDPDVAAALSFIRRRALFPINVADVLSKVPAPRKRLEAGFRRYVGHGIMREIRRLRVQEAQRLLALTDLSMADIAARTAFPSQHKLAVLFRRFSGLTPTEYRRRYRL
jgi:LacI family transcriptional regulator